jgi:NADH-quinone oxidoreductase subunit M
VVVFALALVDTPLSAAVGRCIPAVVADDDLVAANALRSGVWELGTVLGPPLAGLLFAVVGRMVYDRTHTRQLTDLQSLNLSQALPFAAITFTIASVASMGLPGFSGFVAELQVIVGAWDFSSNLALVAGLGILVGVAYTLRALQQAFFSEHESATTPSKGDGHTLLKIQPITVPERIGAVLLIGAALVIGLYPRLLLDLISPSFDSSIFDGLRKAGGM